MDIQKEKQKIEKALRVIDLIETCNWQIQNHLEYIVTPNFEPFGNFKDYYKKRITIMQGVKARLENYYKNLLK